jgi:hypothetical protein
LAKVYAASVCWIFTGSIPFAAASRHASARNRAFSKDIDPTPSIRFLNNLAPDLFQAGIGPHKPSAQMEEP